MCLGSLCDRCGLIVMSAGVFTVMMFNAALIAGLVSAAVLPAGTFVMMLSVVAALYVRIEV